MKAFRLPSRLLTFAFLLAALPLSAEVAPDLMAKFLKVIATHSGSAGRVDVQDPTLLKALENLGVTPSKAAKVAFATTEADVKALQAAGKLVVCNRLDLLPAGGSIAIVDEAGKAVVYLHTQHIAQSGAKVSPAIMRIGK